MATYRTTASVLRLRSGPGMDQAIIGRLPRGTPLHGLGAPVHGWLHVQAVLLDGALTGWVSAQHVGPTTGAPHLPEPPWMAIARQEVGVREYAGAQDNPRIVEYHQATSLQASDDETPWCSSFVNWCMLQAGLSGTQSALARSWEHWGGRLREPRVGCITVFKRQVPGNPGAGHVAFFLERIGNRVHVLGGNQSNSVCVGNYPSADLLSYRWTA
ncbi:MAG: TIGR02594 family protein [Flavobacteriales bacterium]|nr:TIGR02594 family protein [Flavobacteriales bacterium]MBP9081202.1 TIGR02594 family protein [Flavobacteriales bacterium]